MVLACEGKPVTIACRQPRLQDDTGPAGCCHHASDRWLVINSPSNPTGATYSLAEFAALAAVLERHPHVMVMTDDIYEHIRFEGALPRTCWRRRRR